MLGQLRLAAPRHPRAVVLPRVVTTCTIRPYHHRRQAVACSPSHSSGGLLAEPTSTSTSESVTTSTSTAAPSTSVSVSEGTSESVSGGPNESVSEGPSESVSEGTSGSVSEGSSEPSCSGTSGLGTDNDVEVLWNSVERALLRVGKAGFQPSHIASLRELLASHSLVKVQLNSPLSDGVSIEDDIAAAAGATYVKSKGKTLLFACGGLTAEKLQATAASNMARKQRAVERRETMRQGVPKPAAPWSAADARPAPPARAPPPPSPPPPVQVDGPAADGMLGQALQRMARGPLERSQLLQEHEQVLQQLDDLEQPPAPERSKPVRPWQQNARSPGARGSRGYGPPGARGQRSSGRRSQGPSGGRGQRASGGRSQGPPGGRVRTAR